MSNLTDLLSGLREATGPCGQEPRGSGRQDGSGPHREDGKGAGRRRSVGRGRRRRAALEATGDDLSQDPASKASKRAGGHSRASGAKERGYSVYSGGRQLLNKEGLSEAKGRLNKHDFTARIMGLLGKLKIEWNPQQVKASKYPYGKGMGGYEGDAVHRIPMSHKASFAAPGKGQYDASSVFGKAVAMIDKAVSSVGGKQRRYNEASRVRSWSLPGRGLLVVTGAQRTGDKFSATVSLLWPQGMSESTDSLGELLDEMREEGLSEAKVGVSLTKLKALATGIVKALKQNKLGFTRASKVTRNGNVWTFGVKGIRTDSIYQDIKDVLNSVGRKYGSVGTVGVSNSMIVNHQVGHGDNLISVGVRYQGQDRETRGPLYRVTIGRGTEGMAESIGPLSDLLSEATSSKDVLGLLKSPKGQKVKGSDLAMAFGEEPKTMDKLLGGMVKKGKLNKSGSGKKASYSLGEMLEDLRGDMLDEMSGGQGRIQHSHDGSVTGSFSPVDYDWKWTKDWYDWDSKAGHKKAMQERNKVAAEYKAKGYTVKKSTVRGQLITRGGIGSGHPQIEEIVTVFRFVARK